MVDTATEKGHVLDVRTLAPHARHSTIFTLIDALPVGASLIIISDHPPRPLHYQLETNFPGQFSWDYLEEGPQEWRVSIGRLTSAAVDTHECTCGGH